MTTATQRLSFVEKAGYSAADAAANFVFMTMILFQANFYTDVFGISAAAAGAILLAARLWDAFFDPIMGVLADRTSEPFTFYLCAAGTLIFAAVIWFLRPEVRAME